MDDNDVEPDFRSWDAWRELHQPFELEWQAKAIEDGCVGCQQWRSDWESFRAFIEPEGRIIDIGCGPRPPFVPCTVIEPLAREYQRITPPIWWEGVTVYAHPAEHLIEDLRGSGDTIICWNCLDHTIGWTKILDNMRIYMADDDAKVAIATDFWPAFLGHPGYERENFMACVKARFEITAMREPLGRQLALLLRGRHDDRSAFSSSG